VSQQMHEVMSLAIAVGLGALIGLEREINGKPAGLRTNILICLGAAGFTIIAIHFGGGLGTESGRMAAGIVTGVGFLGAGALIQEGSGIHGLTTAASIWLVSSIGVACGAGLFHIAGVVTFMALLVLLALHPLTKKIRRHNQRSTDTPRRRSTDFNQEKQA
jgi:putative Mg2+ transporter-C (MgtC) family protein